MRTRIARVASRLGVVWPSSRRVLVSAAPSTLTRMADRVERLTNLLALLLETPEPLSLVEIAGELGDMYPASLPARRGAFERDKAALREIGVPIESEVVSGGEYAGQRRYWIDRQRYELADLDLEPDEVRALQVAVAATRTGSGSGQEALWKLGAGVLDDDVPVVAMLPSLPALPVLRDAVARRRVVMFRYREVERTVEPYGLLLRDGFWYLFGFDHGRGERRTYRVDRIEDDVAVDPTRTFDRPEFDVRTMFPDDPKLLGADGAVPHAVVQVDAARAALVERELGTDRVVRRDADGAIRVVVPCANLVAFRSWVLGLLDHAEVIEPDEVRDHVVDWLAQLAGRS
jgi:proteasome accessory factor B